jgi:hypothetical protein
MAHAIRAASVAAGHPSPNAGHPQDNNMSSLNFIGGEKGGVGKSVAARVLAQYFLDKGLPFIRLRHRSLAHLVHPLLCRLRRTRGRGQLRRAGSGGRRV